LTHKHQIHVTSPPTNDALRHSRFADAAVPGHGVPVTLKEVAAFRDMLVALRAAVAENIKAGSSEDAASREVRLPTYASIPRYDDWPSVDVRAVYRYLRER
jgi:cyclase